MNLLMTDSNEEATAPAQVQSLRQRFGVSCVFVQKLPCADLSIPLATGLLLIERKTPSDFLSSISDGRLFDQCERMANSGKFSAIILHGNLILTADNEVIADGRKTDWTAKAVRAAINAVQWSGTAFMQVPPNGYAEAVADLMQLASKDHTQKPRKRAITFPPLDERVEFLAGIPGIGPKRAQSLLEFVGGFDENNNPKLGRIADAMDWANSMLIIRNFEHRPFGWGNVTVENFRKFMGLRDDEEGVEFFYCKRLSQEAVAERKQAIKATHPDEE